ncbi:MAG: hypothetical protein ABI585_14850 [Betaproteobacteria bacterium]
MNATHSNTRMRDGVVVLAPAGKVSSPDLPSAFSGTSGPNAFVANSGVPVGGSGSQTSLNTYTIVADPGDAAGASLCLAYRFSAIATGTVVSATASVAGGIADPAGFSVSAAAAPATVTAPNPLVMRVTPAVGPVITIFSLGPVSYAAATTQSVSLARSGQFKVQAGDVITFNLAIGDAARAEPTTGDAISSSTNSFSIAECRNVPVPTLSSPLTALLAILLLAVTLAGGFAQVRRSRR